MSELPSSDRSKSFALDEKEAHCRYGLDLGSSLLARPSVEPPLLLSAPRPSLRMHLAASHRRSNSASQSPSHLQEHQQEPPSKQQNQTFQSLASSKRAEVESFASPDQSLTAVEEPSSASSSHGASQSRSRRVLSFTSSAFGVQRLKRLALNNQRLLRKYGITSVHIRDTCNGEATQRFDLPKRCPPSPPISRPARHKPAPKATQFTAVPQNLLRGASASALQTPSANRAIKNLAAPGVQPKPQSSLSMEQRSAVPQQLNRLPPQQMEPGSSVTTETPLLMNLLSNNLLNSNNNTNQPPMNPGNGMPGQHPSMNPNMMRYPQQQQMQSPMYMAQQSPQYMQGRMPPNNMQPGHPMMAQPMNSGMPGQHIQQPMAQQAMPPPAAQVAEQPAAKKRKRQTKKQKEEESKKQQQQAANPMHPGMMPQPGMSQQMHPDFYMMQQQDGQQRVPPMHMANSQMPQYRAMQHPSYGQYPPHYGQPSTSMMGAPGQYQGQQHYPQQMWNPNMSQQHHMAQQSEYHMQQMQRGQMQQTGMTNMQHYAAPQQSPVPDGMKGRIPPPSYNDSMQQQYIQQRQTPSFMSPPPGQPPHPNQGQPNYNMQQQSGQAMHQSQAAHFAQQQHQRMMSEISENVDDIMATIGGDGAEDFDLDSIELEPMRESGELPGMQQQPPSVPTPQQHQSYPAMHPNQMPPPGYNMYGSPSTQQYAQHQQIQNQQIQVHPSAQIGYANQQIQNQQRDHQLVAEQQKTEQKQLERAMNKQPEDPHSPTNIEIPLKQQQQVASAIDSVMERVRSGQPLDDSGASVSSQPTPPPNKRKKQSTAKNAQQQSAGNASRAPVQMPVQTMPQQQPQHGQFPGQMQQMYGSNGQHPGTPTHLNQQQIAYMRQQQMNMVHMRQMSYPNQNPPGPSTPLSAPVSNEQQYFYGQQGIQNGPNGTPLTPSRANSFKNVMAQNEARSNPDTPQQMSQKMFGQENGGSSATSSAAATPSSSSQHRMSIDEQSQSSIPPFQREEHYTQYNGGHANQQHFMFNQMHQQSTESEPNTEMKVQNTAVSLKSQIGDLSSSNNDTCNTPPSANAGISSATPTTANQLNHHVADTEPKNEPADLAPVQVKLELNNSHERMNENILSPNDDRVFGAEITPKSELNGPTTTSTVAE